jgi:hypothetical protein
VTASPLEHLYLGGTPVGDAGAVALAGAVAGGGGCARLRELVLGYDRDEAGEAPDPLVVVMDAGATALAAAAAANSCLTRLTLGGCGVGDSGATALAGALGAGRGALRDLCVDNNRIGDAGMSALATALAGSTCLTTLNARANRAGEAGGRALLAALRSNLCLRRLWYYDNEFSDGLLDEIGAEMRSRFRSSPHVWACVRLRALCLAGRAVPCDGAGGCGPSTWTLAVAPLWVLVRVCGLLVDEARRYSAM